MRDALLRDAAAPAGACSRLGFAFLTANSAMAIYRSKGDPAAVAFVAFSYLDLLLLYYCHRRFESAAPGSPARRRLKVAVWLLTTMLTAVLSYKVAAIMPLPVQVLVWAMAAAVTGGGFYALFMFREGKESARSVPGSELITADLLSTKSLASRNWRNKVNAGEKVIPVESLVADINHWAIDSLNFFGRPRTENSAPAMHVWKRPEDDRLKINCDGAFSATEGTGGWGFVIRDQAGDVRGSGAGCMHHVASVLQAEAIACNAALQAASQWGMVDVEIESDCQNLIKALQSSDFDRAPEGILFKEIREFARLNFNVVSFNFAPRACNKLAHAIAAFGATHQVASQLWPEDLPEDVFVRQASGLAVPV